MDVEPIAHVPSPRLPVQPQGVTAELAEARKNLREASPANSWDAVAAEVRRLQRDQHLSPLAALQKVHAMLASGWTPPLVR
jgi:hypothetical protein